jgi:hypothetical protein
MVSSLLLIISTLIIGTNYMFSMIYAAIDPAANNYYYSNNVTEATNKFTAACSDAGGSVEYITHPDKGANEEQLQTTVCALGNPQARSIVFTISGTHGIEGYADQPIRCFIYIQRE